MSALFIIYGKAFNSNSKIDGGSKAGNLKPQILKISNTKDKPLRRYFAHESQNLYSLTGLYIGDFMES
jgi:hypothetical protein